MRVSKGFTLLELLVVVMIIAMLTGIVGPRLMSQLQRSESTTARAQMDALDKALQAFRMDVGRYPSGSEGLSALVVAPPSAVNRWRGPYLRNALPLDPWGGAYQYRVPGANGRDYELLSLGKDRAPGGTGDDADIVF